MKRYDLMPSRTLRALLLVLIFMTVALIAAPRDADAALVVKIKSRPVKVISSPRARTVVAARPRSAKIIAVTKPPSRRAVIARRSGPRAVVRCGNEFHRRAWVRGHWERTGPRMSRWVPGHWTLIPRS